MQQNLTKWESPTFPQREPDRPLQNHREALSLQALRNLAFAYKELPSGNEEFKEEMETNFVFVGIMSMIDPPRPEVRDAIALCKKADNLLS